MSMLKYYYRLTHDSSNLLSEGLKTTISLHENGIKSWYTDILSILETLKLDIAILSTNSFAPTSLPILVRKIKLKLVEQFQDNWAKEKTKLTTGKLRTYFTFKYNSQLEHYLDGIDNFETRSAIAKFRLSAHKLKIETGRYNKTPVESRLCENCINNSIEDELHFLFNCPLYSQERAILMSYVSSECPNFSSLSVSNQFIWLLSCENTNILRELGNFLIHSFEKRG